MTDALYPLEGGCNCRRVRYRMLESPMFVHCCHCRWCQRESASKQPWLVLPAGIPAVPEYCDGEQLWPAASLERRRRLLPLIDAWQSSLVKSN